MQVYMGVKKPRRAALLDVMRKLREWADAAHAWLREMAVGAVGRLLRFAEDTGVPVIFLGLPACALSVLIVVLSVLMVARLFSAGDDGGWVAALLALVSLRYLFWDTWQLFFKAKEGRRRDR